MFGADIQYRFKRADLALRQEEHVLLDRQKDI
jgi:hypothetical protein